MRAPNLCNMKLPNSKFEPYFFIKMKLIMLFRENRSDQQDYEAGEALSCSFFSCFMIFFFS